MEACMGRLQVFHLNNMTVFLHVSIFILLLINTFFMANFKRLVNKIEGKSSMKTNEIRYDQIKLESSSIYPVPKHIQKRANSTRPEFLTKPAELTNLTKFNTKQDTMVFLHIGKAGGTSFDETMLKISKQIGLKYIGAHTHFDWNRIESLEKTTNSVKPVTMLRNPVDRTISHYLYHSDCTVCDPKTYKVWKDEFENHTDIEEYFTNYEIMMKTRSFWADGQGAVWWLSGRHTDRWVVGDLTEKQKSEIDEELVLQPYKVMIKAAENLRKNVVWFGILEEQEKSFEMLAYQLGLETISLTWANSNTGKKHQKKIVSDKTRQIIENLIPQDMWLYEYAKLLFEARYNLFKSGVWVEPELPAFPQLNCQTSRYILRCMNPSIYHQLETGDKEFDEKQRQLLPNLHFSQ